MTLTARSIRPSNVRRNGRITRCMRPQRPAVAIRADDSRRPASFRMSGSSDPGTCGGRGAVERIISEHVRIYSLFLV